MSDVNITFSLDGIGDVISKFKELATSGKSVGLALAGLGVGAAAYGAKKLWDLSKSAIKTADDMQNTAKRFGMTTEEMSRLAYMANISDVSLTNLERSAGDLSAKLGAVARDASANKDFMAQFGVSAIDAQGNLLPFQEVLAGIADQFSQMKSPQEKAAKAMEIFGTRYGQKWLPLLEGGGDNIRQLNKEAEELGAVISNETGEHADEFADTMTKLETSFTGVLNKAIVPLMGEFAKLAVMFLQMVRDSGALDHAITALRIGFKLLISALIIVGRTFEALRTIMAGVWEALSLGVQGKFTEAWAAIKKMGSGLASTWEKLSQDMARVWADGQKEIAQSSAKAAQEATKNAQKIGKAAAQNKAQIDAVGNAYRKMSTAAASAGGNFSTIAMSMHQVSETAKGGFIKVADGLPNDEYYQEALSALRGFSRAFTEEIMQMIKGNEANFKQFFENIGDMLVRMMVDRAISRPLEKGLGVLLDGLFGALGGVFSGGGGGSKGGGSKGGNTSEPVLLETLMQDSDWGNTKVYTAAKGGYIPPGYEGLVGEEGPEFIAASPRGRYVTPNHDLGGAGGVTVIQNFNGGITSADLALAMTRVKAETIAAWADVSRRGGRLAGALK